jgi:hypothetical protein
MKILEEAAMKGEKEDEREKGRRNESWLGQIQKLTTT